MRLVYFICRWIGLLKGIVPGLILFKPKLYYEEPGKKPQKLKGGALVVSNHYAVFDYIVSILLFLPRFLRVVSAEFPYHNWFLTFGMNCFRGIKADRTVKSMRFVDESVSAIRSGDKVQVFPTLAQDFANGLGAVGVAPATVTGKNNTVLLNGREGAHSLHCKIMKHRHDNSPSSGPGAARSLSDGIQRSEFLPRT